ncbi:hypothetical protein LCGC14_2338110, partial [marine sediment metagenome]
MSSALISRMLLAFRGGLQFGGKRDLYKIFGYELRPTYDDYFAKYARQDIASRVVDAPAQAVWRNPPEIVSSPEFKVKWDALVKKNKIWFYLERVDRLAGIGFYSTLLVGFNDSSNLEQSVGKADDILYLQPYSQPAASIKSFSKDTKDPRFNLPEMYQLNVSDPASLINISGTIVGPSMSARDIDVHHSRILHVAESVLENEIVGIPRLQKVFNLLDDLMKVVGGSSEMFWLNARQGLQMDVDKDMDLSVPDAEALTVEVEEFQHQLRRFLRTRG